MSLHPEALRQRIVEAYLNGEGTQEELADRFCVHRNTVGNLTRRFRTARTLAARPHGGGPQPLLTPEVLQCLRTLVEENNDRIQSEYAALMKERFEIDISRRSVSRGLTRLLISRKKKRSGPTSKTAPRQSDCERPFSPR